VVRDREVARRLGDGRLAEERIDITMPAGQFSFAATAAVLFWTFSNTLRIINS
jgi:hypothetical protein